MSLRISTECTPMGWTAIDLDSYDVDCDDDGFFSTSPVGNGCTEESAIADLMDQLDLVGPAQEAPPNVEAPFYVGD